VIRIHEHRPGEAKAQSLRGIVEDIATGVRTTFTDSAQLFAALAEPEGGEGSASTAHGAASADGATTAETSAATSLGWR
jgi:hypothetical protein